MRRDLGGQGLNAVVARPPTTSRGSLRGTRALLFVRRASCLERSLIIQRWWAARGFALDVIVGVRHPHLHRGAPGHAWVERWDADCSEQFAEIRRVPAPEGERPSTAR